MIPKSEINTDTLKQGANKAKTKKANTNAYGRKGRERKRLQYTNACDKERMNRPQMPVAKKDQTTNAGDKRKMAALIKQANSWHQMKEIKPAGTTLKTQTVAYLQT